MQEGIFRRSGKLTRQQELKAQLSSSVNVKLNDGQYSVHDCASVLKTILAELQEPLLTETYFPAYCQIAGKASNISVNFSFSAQTISFHIFFLFLTPKTARVGSVFSIMPRWVGNRLAKQCLLVPGIEPAIFGLLAQYFIPLPMLRF